MPRLNQEVRHRDYYARMADAYEDNEPVLIGLGVEFPRVTAQVDTLDIDDEAGGQARDIDAKVVPVNLIRVPNFVDANSNTATELSIDSVWTANSAISASQDFISFEALTNESVRLQSSTPGNYDISQDILVAGTERIAGEVWGRIASVSSGSALSFLVEQLNSSGSVISSAEITEGTAIHGAVTTGWIRLYFAPQFVNTNARRLRVIGRASVSSGGAIDAYLTGMRVVEGALLPWNERTIVGFAVVSAVGLTTPGAPQSLTVTDQTAPSATVTWSAPLSNGGAAITHYLVSINGGADTQVNGTTHSFSVTAGNNYTVEVSAVNSEGEGSAASVMFTATMAPTAPTAPQNLTATDTEAPEATVTWDAPANTGGAAITHYLVSINGGLDTQVSGTSHSFAVTASTSYSVEVSAVNSAGEGAAATTSFTATAPAVVTNSYVVTPGSNVSLGPLYRDNNEGSVVPTPIQYVKLNRTVTIRGIFFRDLVGTVPNGFRIVIRVEAEGANPAITSGTGADQYFPASFDVTDDDGVTRTYTGAPSGNTDVGLGRAGWWSHPGSPSVVDANTYVANDSITLVLPDPAPVQPRHSYTIVAGVLGSVVIGYLEGNAGTIANSTYALPNGTTATIRQTIVNTAGSGGIDTDELRFVINAAGLGTGDTDQFPTRIVVNDGTDTVEFGVSDPDDIGTSTHGIRRDYTLTSGTITDVFTDAASLTVDLYD